MKFNNKKLILSDICSRCVYGVMVQILYHDEDDYGKPLKEIKEINRKLTSADIVNFAINIDKTIESIKPYLRPMSSMTTEEICAITNIIGEGFTYNDDILSICTEDIVKIPFQKINELINFLYARHLDFNHLIEKGLALEAPAGMYNKEDKQ